MRDRGEEDGLGREIAAPDRVRDAHELLVDDAPGADVLVADLGVAHDGAVGGDGEPDILAARADERGRIVAREPGVGEEPRQPVRGGSGQTLLHRREIVRSEAGPRTARPQSSASARAARMRCWRAERVMALPIPPIPG